MNPDFTATCVHVEDMGEFLLVGLADQRIDASDYLTFQRAHKFDEEDVRLAMNEVHVERNDQAFSTYGGMQRVTLFPDHLHLRFDEKRTNVMGLPAMRVFFDFEAAALKSLSEGLAKCFAGFECYRDETGEAA